MKSRASYRREGAVSTITIDDGKVNAMSIAMMREVNDVLDQAEQDGTVLVLTGKDGMFSAGFDLAVFQKGGEELREMLVMGADLCARLLTFPTPVIAASTGHAIAMGSFLLMSTDFRVGGDGPFRIGMNEVAIGLTLPHFAIEVARQRVPVTYFARSALLAEMYEPRNAIGPGFLDQVVPPDQVLATALERAKAASELNMRAHKETKDRVRSPVAEAIRRAARSEFGS